ncbi:MAG TPA: preprotein translocase subunit SecD [Patescibacteria group bacterium]|jgi:protein-export membrane protein SecD|nr:preprotein translocase subunit SecD [Patescibacteria group bacterium]
MKPILTKAALLAGILLIALAAAWIVWPHGSRINLDKLHINFHKDFSTHLGLDLQGGSHLVYQADFSNVSAADQKVALNAVRDTIERRVNSFGVSEPLVQSQGKDQIVVELPGISDVNKAIDQIGQTPLLEFRTQGPAPAQKATVGADGQLNLDASVDPISAAGWQPTGLSGKQLKKATADIQSAGKGSISNEVVVRLQFDEEGTKLFSEITSKNVGKQVAIFLDGKVLSAPTVQTAITNGEAVISGNFTADSAKELATRLNSGALPVPIKLISQQNVGATLGQESINKSVIAGIIGMLLIIIFMIANYRFPGVLAIFALIIYILLSVAVFKIGISITAVILVGVFFLLGLTVSRWFGLLAIISYVVLIFAGGVSPVTLTLAGIAGFILSIGMAVDANILIFERLKEEIRAGKDINKAIDDGFARAWLSIRDSNVSSLITTLILYMFGTPSIKGFAVTLAIGILISMFTAITITRTLLKLFVTGKVMSHPWLFGVSMRRKESINTTSN